MHTRMFAAATALLLTSWVRADVLCFPLNVPLNSQTRPNEVPIDIDQNGTPDITFYAPVDGTAGCAVFAVSPEGGGVICLDDGWSAKAVSLGGKVGPRATFAAQGGLASGGGVTLIDSGKRLEPPRHGAWKDAGDPQYIGVRFVRDGATHYGWVRAKAADRLSIVLQGCAYETTPEVPIAAGAGFEAGIEALPPEAAVRFEALSPEPPAGAQERRVAATAEFANVAPRPAMSIVIALAGLACAFWWRRATPAHFLR